MVEFCLVVWCAESDGVIFIDIHIILRDVSPMCEKTGEFCQARNF